MFFSYFMLFSTFLEKINSGNIFFYFFFISCFLRVFFYARSISNNGRWFLQIVDIGNFNMKLNGRWFPQIVDRDSGNLYPIYIKPKLWC